MKQKQLSKLGLNKKTVANLEAKKMDAVKGGTFADTYDGSSCNTGCFKPISLCVCPTEQPPFC